MGVVYRALDPRLDRPVAIKVLAPSLSDDPDAWERLEREARLLAALNHPNVAAIYGLEESDADGRFLVLEWVEGETLDERLARGGLDLGEGLRIGGEIAAGLDAAHRRGVIHRDLKPANVRLTNEGQVKLLDFGLARRTAGLPSEEASEEVSGSPGYMSPEQVRGLREDARTDVFAFGCVLYECLCGRMAFGGETAVERLRALVACSPDWAALPAPTPGPVRDLLKECLAEAPERRPPDLRSVRERLDRILLAVRTGAEAPPATTNLPRPASAFVGREAHVKRLTAALRAGPLLTLVGPGGSGKTRLALEVARRAQASFPDGVWFVDLAAISDPSLVVSTVASALGVREEPGRPLLEALVDRLRASSALVVLDNCEHVRTESAGLASAATSVCERLRIMATSREPLGVAAERVHRVEGLALPARGDLRAAARTEAVRLFLDRAIAARPGFSLTAGNVDAVVSVCRRLEGIPLALELAAARLRVLSVEQIDARLDDRFRLLAGGTSGTQRRHATLRATMDWSHDLLAEDEKRFFRGLSVFAGGCSLEAARAVAGSGADEFEVLDLLARLKDKSLLTVVAGPGGEARYTFSETVRQYARERSEEAGEGDAPVAAHFTFFLALAERAVPHVKGGPEQPVWLERLTADHENLVAALSATPRGDGGVADRLRLAAALAPYWVARGHVSLGMEGVRAALAAAGDRAPPRVRATALNGLGQLAERRGDFESAVAAYEEGLSIWRALGEEQSVAGLLSNLGVVAKNRGEFARAKTLTEESLAIHRRLGLRESQARNLNNLGTIAAEQGDLDEALARYRDSLAVRRDLGDAVGVATCLTNLAYVLMQRGESGAACDLLMESLAELRRIGVRWGEATVLSNLAALKDSTGDVGEAAVHHRAALVIRRDIEDRVGVAYSLESATGVLFRGGAFPAAARCVGAAARLREDLGAPLPPAERREYETVVSQLRERLPAALWEVEAARGRSTPWREACDEALAALEGVAAKPEPAASGGPRPR